MTEIRAINGRLADGSTVRVELDGAYIAAVTPIPAAGAADQLILPALVDLQVNGYSGVDINAAEVTAEDVTALVRALWRRGVGTVFPTLVTAAEDQLTTALRAIAAARDADPTVAASIPGVHVEGPALSALDGARGAHDPAQLRDPDLAEFRRWQQASGDLVRIVTLAPERTGALPYISALNSAGVVVAVGHTTAEPDLIRAAALAGARLSTHLGNGAPASLPRHPNQLWAQLAEDRLAASFITDGHHLPADTVTAMLRAKGADRSILVSDSAALAGCAPGDYETPVGGRVTVTTDGRLTLARTNLLAGSGRCLTECLSWLVDHTGYPLQTAARMATVNPSRLLGLTDRGAIAAGLRADLIVCSPDLSVRTTLVRGETVHHV